jgi:acetyl-CoA acetyltransferase
VTVDGQRLARLRNDVAIIGAADTDYALDYDLARKGEVRRDSYGYAALAFTRALRDAGLERSDIDGLVVGTPLATERAGEVLGLDVRWGGQADAVNALLQAVLAVHAGLAECVALVYGNDQRSRRKEYGGDQADGSNFLAYVQYAPWGLTSQGALYAMMTRRYMELHGLTSEQLGQIAINQRRFAAMNPNAVMKAPLDTGSYLASRFVCEPLRLFDYCLVNDGGVALIVTTAERARRARKPAVLVTGIGRSEMNVEATSLRPRFIDFYHPAHREASEALYAMAGLGPSDIDLVQVYDSFSAHVLYALEGFGYCAEGDAGRFVAGGATGPGGRLPVNTSGGHLAESYMQGWNHQVEIVRQLRGEAGERQVPAARHAHYISDVAGKVASLIYTKDGA